MLKKVKFQIKVITSIKKKSYFNFYKVEVSPKLS